jgi:cAMP-dependent protein kinase regulator
MVELVRLSQGKFFGELALISKEPRKATVTAAEQLVCFMLDANTFNAVLGNLKQAEEESMSIQILKKVKLLNMLSEKQLRVISRHLVTCEFEDNDVIIQQGDEGDKFYMLITGNVSVFVNHAEVAKLSPGAYFGEMALLNNDRRNASISCIGHCSCLSLDRYQVVNNNIAHVNHSS